MKLNNLQALRGISALLVCCFHFREDINFSHLKIGDFLFKNGSIGVPIFFVISGFIMSHTTRKLQIQNHTIASYIVQFFKRRIIRILPLYYLLTFLWIIASGATVLYFSDKILFSRLVYSLLFLPQTNVPPVLFLGWSLNYEMFFYLIFGASLVFKQNRSVFIISFFVFFYILGHFFSLNNPFWTMITSVLNLYFITGIILSLLLNKLTIDKKIAALISFLGLILFSLFYFKVILLSHELLQVLLVSGLVFAFLLGDYSLKINGNKFLVFLGDISYSLYLSHPFIEVFLRKFKPNEFFSLPFFVAKVFCAILVASILYFVVEQRITAYLKAKLKA